MLEGKDEAKGRAETDHEGDKQTHLGDREMLWKGEVGPGAPLVLHHGRSEGEEEELHGSATGKELQPQEDIEDTEPSMPKRGTKQRIKNVLGGALRAAVRLMVPGKAGLEQVEQQ
eukprot:scaffold278342_cov14-Tisochrysis_lutea.AAC.1